MKCGVEKVILIRTNQVNRNKLKDNENDEEELIKKNNHAYTLKTWKSLLSKIESVEIVQVEKSNAFLPILIAIIILLAVIFVIFGFLKGFSLLFLIPLIIILTVVIIGCIKLVL